VIQVEILGQFCLTSEQGFSQPHRWLRAMNQEAGMSFCVFVFHFGEGHLLS